MVVVLGIEPRALCMLGKHFTTELSYNPSLFFLLRQDLTKLSRQTLNLEISCLNLRGITGLVLPGSTLNYFGKHWQCFSDLSDQKNHLKFDKHLIWTQQGGHGPTFQLLITS